MHQKFDLSRVQTHVPQIMTVHFMSLRRLLYPLGHSTTRSVACCKHDLDKSIANPKFNPTEIRTHDLQIMTVRFHVMENQVPSPQLRQTAQIVSRLLLWNLQTVFTTLTVHRGNKL